MSDTDKKTQLLSTTGMNHFIEDEFKKSEKFIFIVSPYVELNEKIAIILREQIAKGIQVTIMCRVENLKTKINLDCPIIDNPRIHAKCYITENMAILGSLNLYDFSQKNNDEMGIITYNEETNNNLYSDILQEINLLKEKNQPTTPLLQAKKYPLEQDKTYSVEDLEKIFNFTYKDNAGIKLSQNHQVIVLFSNTNSKYANKSENGLLLYKGQNTGGKQQELIYGNKELYDTYVSNTKDILLFEDYCYKGQVKIVKEPYQNEDGKWIFPLQAI